MRLHPRMIAPAICAAAFAIAAPVAIAAASTVHTRTVSGTVIAASSDAVTIQTSGQMTGIVDALTLAANAVTAADLPYVWGGGHAQAGVPSIGIKGPGYNGKRVGYDCSGSVAAVLAGAGLWTAGGSVPADNGVIKQLLAEHLIAKGVGTTASEVTLYDDPGVHIFMNIDGRFFGTSDGGGGGDAKGGPGWLDDGAWDATDPAFKAYHVLPSVLRTQARYSSEYTVSLPAALADSAALTIGEKLRVSFTQTSSGRFVATAMTASGHTTTVTTPTTTTTTTTTTTVSEGGEARSGGVGTGKRKRQPVAKQAPASGGNGL